MGGMAMRQEDPMLQKKRKEKSDKGDSHRTLTFTSWVGFGPMWAGQGPEVAWQLQHPDLPSPEGPQTSVGLSGLSPSKMVVQCCPD